ncbi:MAG: TetR/AcrR family transcriptional regulator [Planctomycetota bacterium]
MAKKASPTAQRIIEAATQRFLTDGYDGTNLEDVASDSGVTKPTVYSHFGSKQALLIAITEAHVSDRASVVSSALATTGNTHEDLKKFASVFLQRLQSEEAQCWHHLALSQAREHPEVGKAIFASGPARVLGAVTEYIKNETKAGRLTCKSPDVAAEQFLGMLIGLNSIRTMTGEPLPSKAKQQRACKEVVKTFMAAFAKESQ